MQWGYASATGSITFPIAFESACYTVITALTQDRGTSGGVTDKTTTTFTLVGYAAYWIACGNQTQWGILQSSYTFTYPLALKDFYAYYVSFYEGYTHWTTEAPSCSYTTTNITAPGSPSPPAVMFFLILGKQQWGNCSANAIVTFPITVATVYVVVTTSYGMNWGFVTDLTTTSFKNANNADARYIAIGKQFEQWGIIAPLTSVVSTPLSMTSFYAGLVAWYNCTPDSNARFIGIESMSGNSLTVDATTTSTLTRSYVLIGE